MTFQDRLKGAGIALALLIAGFPAAIAVTIFAAPFWLWFEGLTGIEAYGHSGPSEWCYLVDYGLLVAISAFIWSHIHRKQMMTATYPDSFDAVSEKHESGGFDALNEKEQAIYTIWWLEAEVNNGGFHQYFWNSAGDHADTALQSLKNIGASKTASLLEQAIKIAFGGNLPSSREERQKQLEIDEGAKMEKLEELDSEFYEYSEDFYKILDAYVAMPYVK